MSVVEVVSALTREGLGVLDLPHTVFRVENTHQGVWVPEMGRAGAPSSRETQLMGEVREGDRDPHSYMLPGCLVTAEQCRDPSRGSRLIYTEPDTALR